MKDVTASGLTAEHVLDILGKWDAACTAPLHLVACGDAALTLSNFRAVTQEVDLLVPLQAEYDQFRALLPTLGFQPTPSGFATAAVPGIVWRCWPDQSVFGAQLVESPLDDGNHTDLASWQQISLSVLNLKDLIITLIFRGRPADIDHCIAVFETWKVDAEDLLERYAETSKSADHPDDMMRRFMEFVEHLASQQLVSDEVWARIARSGREDRG